MAHAVLDEPRADMGLPLPSGKLAIWLFLVTEIMFFTGLIGYYIISRNGTPTEMNPWPLPHDVHLAEWMGAVNTFVLICSSLTVVLAHHVLAKGDVKRATLYIGVTLALGCVFLAIKAVEYKAKFDHAILPGQIFEKLDGPTGPRFRAHVQEQLTEIVEHPDHTGASAEAIAAFKSFETEAEEKTKQINTEFTPKAEKLRTAAVDKLKKDLEKDADQFKKAEWAEYEKTAKEIGAHKQKVVAEIESSRKALIEKHKSIAAAADCWALLQELPNLSAKKLNLKILGTNNEHVKPCDEVLLPDGTYYEVKEGLLEKHPDLHVSNAISFGNLWASCYFAMTGFHAIHVLGGLVVFVIMLVMAWRGVFSQHHERFVELTGLYWHFVDVVWIFLFPLLYLV